MFQSPNCFWECKECGEKKSGHRDPNSRLEVLPPNCPKCGQPMEESPIIRDGPPEHPFKKH